MACFETLISPSLAYQCLFHLAPFGLTHTNAPLSIQVHAAKACEARETHKLRCVVSEGRLLVYVVEFLFYISVSRAFILDEARLVLRPHFTLPVFCFCCFWYLQITQRTPTIIEWSWRAKAPPTRLRLSSTAFIVVSLAFFFSYKMHQFNRPDDFRVVGVSFSCFFF